MIWYDKYNEILQSFPKHGCIVVDNILNLSTIAYLHLLDQQIVSQFQKILFVYKILCTKWGKGVELHSSK